ncbi:MAG: pyruvate ferredoxin oxidoreductase [Nitrospira sp.]|nr:pyruvate ferredoxin oxidoreductase [Nitrospira sp.]MDH4344642.1 pyruvate ferredoxin oxidoreductase [Nitrospira sp.]MDH5337300.1 pyruvate ferredoxin oxidoreductase [Nitrospira sp.]
MRAQIEGSQAVAEAVVLCRPEVIAAYPISPQTHIVERLSRMVKQGDAGRCQYLNVESEFGALSVLIGASAAGARTYTATTSQGLLFMAEAVYNAAGLGLPIVMTIANRAVGAPINIWNDHSDSMALRDAGWIQLYAETGQEAADLHIQAFRLAEELSCPVMVCMDGYILTHAYEPIDLPDQASVDAFLPPFSPVQVLDPNDPISIGAMVGPEAFTEVKYLAHQQHLRALTLVPDIADSFEQQFHRGSGGLYRAYRMADADTVVIALGSVIGTIKDAVDELRDEGIAAGCVKIGCYRPFPTMQLRTALKGVSRVIVVEKDLAVGIGGIVSADVRMALNGLPIPVHTIIAGLGGRSIPAESLKQMVRDARAERLSEPYFLDLNMRAVDEELARRHEQRRAGPLAEQLIRTMNAIGSKVS